MKAITAPAPKPKPPAVTVRMAENSDGPTIGALVVAAGFAVATLDWAVVHPWWLVAEIDGEIVGCIDILPSRPVGRLEMLATHPDLSNRKRAVVVKALVLQGTAVLEQAGCERAAGLVPEELPGYRRILEHRGARVIAEGALYAKRLR